MRVYPDNIKKGRESGIAYIAILFLMALVSSLTLTFLNKAGMGASSAAVREAGMQAYYLAESAANHAMWRLLNEGDFPPEEDKYYMHSLAGGRYGYKVRRHTNTTFATIATVGVVGENTVHQSYVLYIKPSMESGIVWFLDSDSKVYTPNAGSWQQVDLSADEDIPASATGLILEIVNENNSYSRRGQVRATGSSDNRTLGARVSSSSQVTAFVKLDGNKTFEAYRDSYDIKFYIRGYTGSKIVFFENWRSFNVRAPQFGLPETIDLSDEGVPGNSIAILEFYDGDDEHLQIRRNGDSDYSRYCQSFNGTHQFIMVGLDSQSRFQYYYDPGDWWDPASTYENINLVGYAEDVGTWMSTPSLDVSGYTVGSWIERDITLQTSQDARVAFANIEFTDRFTNFRRGDLRAKGSSDDQFLYSRHLGASKSNIFYLIGLDSAQCFETKIESRRINMYVLGYTEPTF